MEEQEVKTVSIEELVKLDLTKVTLLDVRESDEVLVKAFPNSINIPFSKISKELSQLPKEKTVYVFCSTGDLSGEVAEILLERGYTAFNVEGGFKAYEKYIKNHPIFIDAKGLKCPGPIVKVADTIRTLQNGQQVQVEATENIFHRKTECRLRVVA